MNATKIGTASALLIGTLAVAFTPTAAADGVQDCANENPIPQEGEDNDAVDCVENKSDECQDFLTPMTIPEYASCLTGE